MLVRLSICGAMAAARLAEMLHSRRNIAASGPAQEGRWSRRTFPLVIAVHGCVIGGTLLWGRGPARRFFLVPLLLMQPLRAWILLTLGRRWNTRGVVARDMPVETGGPYAFVRHPNYAVVVVELWCLPAAFGLYRLALVASLLNACLLGIRIRDEEALLLRLPGYRDHFGPKRRLIPGLF